MNVQRLLWLVGSGAVAAGGLAARGETPAAFGRRCIPADCVAPPSNIPDIAPHRAQDARWGSRSAVVAPHRRGPHGADCAPWGGSAGRLAALGATPDFHHGLLAMAAMIVLIGAGEGRAQSANTFALGGNFSLRGFNDELVRGHNGPGLLWRFGRGDTGWSWQGALNWFSADIDQAIGGSTVRFGE